MDARSPSQCDLYRLHRYSSLRGMTGTRQAVFGAYADVYDIQQAIDDHATVPIYYEMRLIKLLPDEEGDRRRTAIY